MESQAASIARQLGREAEAVCRHYLSNGRRQGRYWIVGDVDEQSAAAASMSGSRDRPRDQARQANGPTPPPASTATCST